MDFSAVARLAGGFAEARAIQAALELGVFEVLRTASTAAQLAGSLACDPRAMELLLNALVSTGLLNKTGSVYSLSEASSTYLVKNSPKYLGGMIAFDASLWDAWGRLAESVRTGKPARAPELLICTRTSPRKRSVSSARWTRSSAHAATPRYCFNISI